MKKGHLSTAVKSPWPHLHHNIHSEKWKDPFITFVLNKETLEVLLPWKFHFNRSHKKYVLKSPKDVVPISMSSLICQLKLAELEGP